MANSTGLWDLSGRSNSLPSGSISGGTSANESQNVSGTTTQSQSQATSGKNTPQFALDAMQQLVQMLMGTSNISEDDLNKQVPLPNPENYRKAFGGTGPSSVIPNNSYIDWNAYNADLKAAQAKRNQLQQQAGFTNTSFPGQQREGMMRSIAEIEKNQAGYTKEAALADVNDMSGRFMRQLMEQLMPNITNAIESSGTSGGAVGGLLAQDAAARTMEAQAALGLEAASKYGQIYGQFGGVLNQLLTTPDPVVQALLQTLGLSKGTINESVTSGSSTTSENKTINATKAGTENKVYAGAPGSGTFGGTDFAAELARLTNRPASGAYSSFTF